MILSERLLHLEPYLPGEQPKDKSLVKLNTNENPYPPSPRVAKVLKDLDAERLRLYPDPLSIKLRQVLAELNRVGVSQVFTGNGSDEVLSFVFYALFGHGGLPVLFPEHTYSFYPVYCSFYGIPYKAVPMERDFSISLSRYLEYQSSGIIFPNPNAPTGIVLSRREVEEFLKAYDSERPVVLDEAYCDFGGETSVPLIRDHPNLLIVSTLSKSRSLAGLRIGYALGSEEMISVLFMVKDSFNSYPLDLIAQEAATEALKDQEYFVETTARIIRERERVTVELSCLGFETLPSKANFLFTRKRGFSGEEIYTFLRREGILVRYFPKKGIEDFVRITLGKPEDNTLLLEALSRFTNSAANRAKSDENKKQS